MVACLAASSRAVFASAYSFPLTNSKTPYVSVYKLVALQYSCDQGAAVPLINCTIVEGCTIVIAACIPSAHPVIKKLIPGFVQKTLSRVLKSISTILSSKRSKRSKRPADTPGNDRAGFRRLNREQTNTPATEIWATQKTSSLCGLSQTMIPYLSPASESSATWILRRLKIASNAGRSARAIHLVSLG